MTVLSCHEGTSGRTRRRFSIRGINVMTDPDTILADDGPWDESYLVALEEMVADLEMSFGA